jgi:hypothetical protein
MAGERQVFLDQPLRQHLDAYEPDFAAFAIDPKCSHRLCVLLIAYIDHNGPRLGGPRQSTSIELERITDTQCI